MSTTDRPLAVVTDASTGIGLELARLCAANGFDLVIAAEEMLIENAAAELSRDDRQCVAVQCDLSTGDGVEELLGAIDSCGRPVDVLAVNAGRALSRAFLDQDIDEVLRVVRTNVDGTIYLVHRVGGQMRRRHEGRILITGSIAGSMPGPCQAVYDGTMAFLDSFSVALHRELSGSGVTVTCLMPGATETEFFQRAGMMSSDSGTLEKGDAAQVAKAGFAAMMRGEVKVVAGSAHKIRAAMTRGVRDPNLVNVHKRFT